MTDSRKIVKVFLASPGDLADERRAAKSVVDEYNALTAEEFGYQVELVGWEDTVSVYGRPQAIINRDLERCELFVGLLWKKWGTPPDVAGLYSSGFEEEFETSVQRRSSKGSPEISLLFKEIDQTFLGDPGEDLKKVLAFKERLISEKRIYFEGFVDIQEFERKFRRCIWTYVSQLRAKDNNEASAKNQAPTRGGEKQPAAITTSSPAETPLSAEGAKFLREFISRTERSAEEKQITAVEIARFRLLASLVGRGGNDDRSLGVHDANLLFSESGEFTFGYQELGGLVTTGFRHYSDENTPLWRWFAAIDGFARSLLPTYSIFGSDTGRRAGALAAMSLIAEPIPSEDRNDVIANWLAEGLPSNLKVVALGYLDNYGIPSDLATIRSELDRGDNQTVRAAADAIIRINLRDSRERGFAALYELQPTSISHHVLGALFDNETALSTETLIRGVDHRSPEVRRIVVKLLRSRRALTNETAEQLTNDSDAAVRYEALMFLVEAGRTFSDAEARTILVKQTRPGSRGGLSAFGLLGYSDPAAEQFFVQFREQRLRSLKDKDLEDTAAEDSIYDGAAEFVLTERYFNLRGDDLRQKVDDQYRAAFSRALDAMAARYGSGGDDLVEKARSLENFTRKKLTRQGLDIICRKAEPSDLRRVRSALKSGFVDYSASDVEYLQKFGEWEDIPLIIEAVQRPEAGRTQSILASALDDSKYRAAARAIYTLGRTRLSEVLSMPAPSQLLAHLVAESSDKTFRSLSDISIMGLLRSEAEQVRKVSALKCVRALSKGRVSKFLASYVSGNQYRYYNVVHWLDFGVSAPRDRALLGAEKVLNMEWRSSH